jgi:hypothetical protein
MADISSSNKLRKRGMKPSLCAGEKLFVVRKYILAKSAIEAIRKDKLAPVDDVWIDEEFKKTSPGASAIGFVDYRQEE